MTNYTKSTNFASKDSLDFNNPLKIVKGSEIDAEFNNIATAVNTKANSLSPTFTGTPLAPTAAVGTNTTQIATTAFVLQAIYPVGSIYINASVSTNPATLFGFGTWVAFGGGRVPVGISSADSLFDTLEETGGAKNAVVPLHDHFATSTVTDPGHYHNISMYGGAQGNTSNVNLPGYNAPVYVQTQNATTGITVATTVTAYGVNPDIANLQPYIVVAMWKRTA